jgi:hypothetical protein
VNLWRLTRIPRRDTQGQGIITDWLLKRWLRSAQNKRYDELRSKKDEISGYEALSIAFAQPHGSPELEPDPDAPPKKGMQLLKDYFQNQQ